MLNDDAPTVDPQSESGVRSAAHWAAETVLHSTDLHCKSNAERRLYLGEVIRTMLGTGLVTMDDVHGGMDGRGLE